jgi:WD40 repeat protein
VKDGAQLAILRGHGAALSSAVFSPNGLYVVTASATDRTVRLWDAQSGQEIALLTGQHVAKGVGPALTRAVFTSDGTRIAIVSGEENVRIIQVFPTVKEMVDYAHRVVPRELTPCERRRFFLPVEGDVGDCPG